MPFPLPIRPLPAPRETVLSFLSRFAAMNAAEMSDFSIDLGYQIRRFLDLETAALDCLAEAAGLEPAIRDELDSWTGVPAGDIRMAFRGEAFVSRALRNPVMRGCPLCLQEDAQATPGHPEQLMAMRGDWLLRSVNLCCRHHHPLVPLWEVAKPAERFDSAARLRDLAPKIMAGAFDRPCSAPTDYDLWLDRRLETGEDPTWLAGHGVYAVTTICALFGMALLQHRSPEASTGDRREAEAQAAGFAVLSQGEAAFRQALRDLARSSGGTQIAPRQTFGKLYVALDDYLTDAAFDPFRTMLRDCILETWPVAAGERVLGEVLPARRLHNPRTAANEIGVSTKLVEQILTDAGALPAADPRPSAQRIFDAAEHAWLLAEIPTLVGRGDMLAAMGATEAQLRTLREEKIIRPLTEHPRVKAPWRLADGLALVAELHALTQPDPADGSGWEALQFAKQRTGLPVGAMLNAIRERRMRVARDPGQSGYRSFMVLKAEVDSLAGARPHVRRRDETTAAGQPASVFANSIGMRRSGWYPALHEAGHAPAFWSRHPVTRRAVLYVSGDDEAKFHRRFLTPTTMQSEFGLHRQTCTARLRAAGISPFSPGGADLGPLYLRQEAEPVLQKAVGLGQG
ncbi:TniQ family protein [Salipiger sp. IMCC34102]|uniref:TniQ family protein n=1 Tax=Salipiger sp. IMCC34102 TaxID=2510647 RepID=UPI001F5DF71A|nr:TniQ family protein [Salipiger sp. IMCC34102]